MNKQEAIERIKNLYSFIMEDGPFEVGLINKNQVLGIISQIDEPHKPVVPKFVAEWLEECKRSGLHLQKALYRLDDDEKVSDWAYDENDDLIAEKADTFARAWLDGYEVEKEPLYTVEMPNPNLNAHTVLQKTEKGVVLISVTNARWRGWESSKLTESEIKQDFDFLWQFAKEVEV